MPDSEIKLEEIELRSSGVFSAVQKGSTYSLRIPSALKQAIAQIVGCLVEASDFIHLMLSTGWPDLN